MGSDHSVNQRLEKYLRLHPAVDEDVYIAKSAVVLGAVTLGKNQVSGTTPFCEATLTRSL